MIQWWYMMMCLQSLPSPHCTQIQAVARALSFLHSRHLSQRLARKGFGYPSVGLIRELSRIKNFRLTLLCCGCWIIYSKIQNSPFISKHVDRHVKNVVVSLFLLPVVCPQLWVLWYPSDLSCYQVTWSPLCTETWSLWIFCWDQPALKILFDRSLIYNHYIIWVIKIIYFFSINHMHINRWLNNQFISICNLYMYKDGGPFRAVLVHSCCALVMRN